MKFNLLIYFVCILLCTNGYSQTRTISGKVTSAGDNQPIPGVSVKANIGNTSSQTNADGYYSIAIPTAANTIIFSSVGYVSKTINIQQSSIIDVILESSTSELGEVLVVGYGTQSKTEFTGSASRISGETIKDIPIQSFDQALQGKAAGVSIASPNGVLNNPPVIRIRGINSISLSSYPLVVVDGVPINTGSISNSTSVPNNPLGDINPADIESIDVLKDAASASIYGSRAAAGVLLVTTKRGKTGNAKINYDVWGSVTKATRLPKLLDATQYIAIKNEAVNNSKILGGNADNDNVASELFFPSYLSNGNLVNTNWYDHVYQTGNSQNHSLNVSGGSEKTSYYFSANFSDQNGFLVDNRFKRKGVRFNIDHQANNWLKIRGGATYNNTFNQSFSSGTLPSSQQFIINAARAALVLPPNVLAYNEDGSYNIQTGNGYIGTGSNRITTAYYNPIALFEYSRYTSENEHFQGNIGATVKIFKFLDFNTTYAIDRLRTENISFLSPSIGSSGFSSNGSATNISALRNNWNWNGTLNYDQRFADVHHLGILLGRDIQHFDTGIWGANATQASDPFFEYYQGGWSTVVASGNTLGERNFVSTFGRINYDFRNRYFITGNFRRDGNSALAAGRKYGNFGGVSAGWALSEESFYQSSGLNNIVNNIKLRGSWGRVGNGNLNDDYAALNLFNPGLYGNQATWALSQAGNNLLTWETSEQTNIGADLSFLNNRFQLEFTYFHNNVNGLILETPQSASKGIPGNVIVDNVGSLYNKGIEFLVSGNIIAKENFKWSSSINFTHVKNRVTALGEGNADIISYTHTSANSNNVTRVGHSVGSLYGAKTDGVNPENGRRIFVNAAGERVQYSAVVAPGESNWTYLDGSTAPAISSSDYYLLANALPTFYGGFTNNFTYKAVDLSIHFTYAGGNYLMNGTKATLRDQTWYNNYTDILQRWTSQGQVTDIPRLVYNDIISNGSSFPISANVEKADFIRLQNVLLGYRLPQNILNRIGIANARIYAQASNLFLITGYTGSDPESSVNGNNNTNPGVERNSIGQGRTFALGLNVGF